MTYWAYNVALTVTFVLGLPFLPLMFLFGERFWAGLWQRFGHYSGELQKRLSGSRPVWVHAASVGEVRSAVALTQEVKRRFPDRKLLLSTFTLTGKRTAEESAAADAVIFLPLDHPWIVRKAFATFKPSALILLETEIWPNLIREAHKKGIPTLLLSGRLSVRAFKKYSLLASFFRRVLQCFTAMGMQSEADVERMVSLGADRQTVSMTGSLKRVTVGGIGHKRPATSNGSAGKDPPLLVVGSSHRGEEEILLNVFVALKNKFPNLQMVLAPRHPQRFSEVEKLLQNSSVGFEKKSQINGRFNFDKDVLLLDTMGDLPNFYAIGDIAFVGGSLVDSGGHNLLEPARFHKPVLFGPHMTNFSSLAAEMKEKGGGIQVDGAEDLIRVISDLVIDAGKRRAMGETAFQIAADDHGVLKRSFALIARYLHPGRIPKSYA